MEQLFLYLLKSSGLVAVFYLSYHFLMRKETFFNSNRWFLLSGLVTSLLLPMYFVKKTIWVERTPIQIPDFAVPPSQPTGIIQTVPVVEVIDWTQLIWIGYLIVASVFAFKIALNLASLYRMLYNQQVFKKESFKLVNLNNNVAPFSFFNYIVYNADLYSDEELRNILLHEKIHSREKHSIDVLVSELFCAVFWFNPFIWLYKKAITQNLEYIADQKSIEQLDDKKSYQHALLKVVSNQNCLPITNNFYQSLIKKRIVMLNKNQSQKRNSWKYAMVIPALIGFVFLFQIKVEAMEKPEAESNIKVSSKVETIWTKSTTDSQLKEDALRMSESNIIFDFTEIHRNSSNEITSITITFSDDLGNNDTSTFENKSGIQPIHFIRDINAKGKGQIGYFGENDLKYDENVVTTGTLSTVTSLIFDKISSDKGMKSDAAALKSDFNIDLKVSNLKRNEKGEIIAITMSFDDNNGNKGKVEQIRTIPIRPIFFKASKSENGKTTIGFYDNSDMVQKPVDAVNENKITTIESIKDDALIYVDGDRYTKDALNDLDPKGLAKIEVLKDAASLAKYGAKDRTEVIVITTNWPSREENIAIRQQMSPSIITLANGDEVVILDKYNVKIAGYPSVSFTENSPVLIVDGVQQKNPRLTFERMNLTKIKAIKVLDSNEKETKGTPIYKLIISTK